MRILYTALSPALTQRQHPILRAGDWFLSSGIQESGGGVARYFRLDKGSNARVSTEITGYAVSTLVYLYDRTGMPGFLSAAERAGKFLTGTAWNPALGTFPFEHSADGDTPQALAYFFDCGIIIRGLILLARATGESGYLKVATQAGRSLAADFAGPAGYHPIVELPSKSPLAYAPQWSRSPGCYQLKSALAWHYLAEATGEQRFEALYESAVVAALEAKDRFLPAETVDKTMDRLHAYCYFLEGMLPLAGRSDCAAALAEGIDRVSNYLRSIRPVFERSDVYAQLLRVRLFGNQIAGIPLNRSAAEDEAARIAGFQLEDPLKDGDARHCGGFWFGRNSAGLMPFVNPVSTAFCLQALEMWSDFEAGRRLDPATLI
jgi:hypothetical protein